MEQDQINSSLLGRRKSKAIDINVNKLKEIKQKAEEAQALSEFNAIEYAKYLNRSEIVDIISMKLKEPPLIERWLKVVDGRDFEEIKKFKEKIKSALKLRELVNEINI